MAKSVRQQQYVVADGPHEAGSSKRKLCEQSQLNHPGKFQSSSGTKVVSSEQRKHCLKSDQRPQSLDV